MSLSENELVSTSDRLNGGGIQDSPKGFFGGITYRNEEVQESSIMLFVFIILFVIGAVLLLVVVSYVLYRRTHNHRTKKFGRQSGRKTETVKAKNQKKSAQVPEVVEAKVTINEDKRLSWTPNWVEDTVSFSDTSTSDRSIRSPVSARMRQILPLKHKAKEEMNVEPEVPHIKVEYLEYPVMSSIFAKHDSTCPPLSLPSLVPRSTLQHVVDNAATKMETAKNATSETAKTGTVKSKTSFIAVKPKIVQSSKKSVYESQVTSDVDQTKRMSTVFRHKKKNMEEAFQ